MQGDGQIPEGFYHIDRFNPSSTFHLSLGLNYPNKSDRILGRKGSLGGDIFIHGDCVTIGCMPITDEKIKELYLITVEARNRGQRTIPVHVFPGKMDEKGMGYLMKNYMDEKKLLKFWENIKVGYDYFDRKKKLPMVSIKRDGSYSFR